MVNIKFYVHGAASGLANCWMGVECLICIPCDKCEEVCDCLQLNAAQIT